MLNTSDGKSSAARIRAEIAAQLQSSFSAFTEKANIADLYLMRSILNDYDSGRTPKSADMFLPVAFALQAGTDERDHAEIAA